MQPPDRWRDRCWTMAVTSLALIAISVWSWQARPPEPPTREAQLEQAR